MHLLIDKRLVPFEVVPDETTIEVADDLAVHLNSFLSLQAEAREPDVPALADGKMAVADISLPLNVNTLHMRLYLSHVSHMLQG